MDPQAFVNAFVQAMTAAAASPFPPAAVRRPPAPAAEAPRVMIFAPHPDDECIIGLLPLRLQHENRWRVINVPVTHGSNPARQAERHQELQQACALLGWTLLPPPPATATEPCPAFSAPQIARLLEEYLPNLLLFPHMQDWNARHISTHRLLIEALRLMPDTFTCLIAETEFWGAMDDPNLLVEASADDLADLVAATACHTGEVQRNPYHLRLPAWMMDNVRRGAERIHGQGHTAPEFLFATPYRLQRWKNRQRIRLAPALLPCTQSPEALLHGSD